MLKSTNEFEKKQTRNTESDFLHVVKEEDFFNSIFFAPLVKMSNHLLSLVIVCFHLIDFFLPHNG